MYIYIHTHVSFLYVYMNARIASQPFYLPNKTSKILACDEVGP